MYNNLYIYFKHHTIIHILQGLFLIISRNLQFFKNGKFRKIKIPITTFNKFIENDPYKNLDYLIVFEFI